MESIWTILIIVLALSKLFSQGKKKKGQEVKKVPKTRSIEKAFGELAEMFGMEEAPAAPKKTKAAPAQPVYTEGTGSMSAFSSQLGDDSLEGKSGYGFAPAGSLDATSAEGFDVCDPSLGHDDHSTGCDVHEAMQPLDNMELKTATGLDLDLDSEGLVKAFIMSEVLTRPAQRLQRRG